MQENTRAAESSEEFYGIMESSRGFVRAFWCGEAECEDTIQERTTATIRVIPIDGETSVDTRKCVQCGKPAQALAYWAKAY
jgi:prolyl-tRNA synthetase